MHASGARPRKIVSANAAAKRDLMCSSLAHGERSEGLDVGHYVDHHRALRLESARERRREISGLLHAQSERAHAFGEAREVGRIEGPQLARLPRLLAAVGAIEAALRLVPAAIVVHHL